MWRVDTLPPATVAQLPRPPVHVNGVHTVYIVISGASLLSRRHSSAASKPAVVVRLRCYVLHLCRCGGPLLPLRRRLRGDQCVSNIFSADEALYVMF